MAGIDENDVVIIVTSVAGGVAFVVFLVILIGLIWLLYKEKLEKQRPYPTSLSRQSMDDLFMSHTSNTPPPYYDHSDTRYYTNEAFKVGGSNPGTVEPATRPSSWTHIDTHSPYAIPRPKASSRSSLLYDDGAFHYGWRNPDTEEQQLES